MRTIALTVLAVLIMLPSPAWPEESIGNLSANPYDPDSTSNRFGRYGSPFSPDSINNPFGAGSPFRPDSPTNPYGRGLRLEGR